jgi:DNA invertase Pin-like site-specific DNA recombinase
MADISRLLVEFASHWYIMGFMRKRIVGDPKIAVAYLRVSTESQDLGPDAQRNAIERWAAARGVQIAAWFEDHGVSGGTAIERRPGLLAALAALQTHRAGVLVASKRDRIARDTVITAMVEQAARRAGAVLSTADGSSDGAGPEGALMRGIVDVFAAYERGVIKARTKAALAVKRSRGERIGQVGYGWRLADDGVHLVEDHAEQAIIKAIRDMRSGGLSLRGVVAECSAAGPTLARRTAVPADSGRQDARMTKRGSKIIDLRRVAKARATMDNAIKKWPRLTEPQPQTRLQGFLIDEGAKPWPRRTNRKSRSRSGSNEPR